MNKIKNISFSVCMSVYRNDCPAFLKDAIESITTFQTIQPTEIILVKDGPLGAELDAQVDSLSLAHSQIKVVAFEKNQGLGIALREAINNATYDLIARMDSDDIASCNRFEKQLAYLSAHPETDIIGGQIDEFITRPNAVVGRRIVPCGDKEIYSYMKRRCPFNHMTVMFRKQSVLNAGNYIDWHYNEDYFLWIRMALEHMRMANIPDILVHVRVGEQMYKRRGGYTYFKSEKGIQRYMYRNHLINGFEYLFNVAVRFVVQVILPNNLRGKIFQMFFRK